MAFKIKRGPFERTVTVREGEQYAIMASIPTDADFSGGLVDVKCMEGWSGVNDTDTHEPLPFTPENWAEFVADDCIAGAVWRALGELRKDAVSGELYRGN